MASGNNSVRSGPFKGMKLGEIKQVVDGRTLPQLVGSYESELHEAIDLLLQTGYTQVINVGCANGYYAVGFALRMPEAKIFAFDIDSRSRSETLELARINGVSDRITVGGECDAGTLNGLASPTTIVLMDCEGCEKDLLDIEAAPQLRACDLLVELHDFAVPDVSTTISRRFSGSHDQRFISSEPRDPDLYPILEPLTPVQRLRALSESRGIDIGWALLTAKRD